MWLGPICSPVRRGEEGRGGDRSVSVIVVRVERDGGRSVTARGVDCC